MPMTCDADRRVQAREAVASEIADPLLGRSPAAVAGQFVGDERTDLAVLSFDNYAIRVLENVGAAFPVVASYDETTLAELYDLMVLDVDGDGDDEFVMLSFNGDFEVLDWDGSAFTQRELLTIGPGLVSFTAADLLGDPLPELVVSGEASVHVVPNMGGMFDVGDRRSASGEFEQPWDTLVVGTGTSARIVVPESNPQSTMGIANQDVGLLRLSGDDLVAGDPLGTEFQNPYALAQGDFLGGDEIEIVVAERRLNLSADEFLNGTTDPGRLRFFRLEGDAVTEVGAPLEIGIAPFALAAADLDCDGKTDLVIGTSGRPGMDDGRPQAFFGSCAPSAREEDLMTFPQVGDTGISAGSRLAVGDFDDDGLLEVAIPDFGDPGSAADPAQRVVIVGVQEAS
jgi:hypothetical protein